MYKTSLEVLKRIDECERARKFDSHVDPIDYSNAYRVDKNFRYVKKGFKLGIKHFFVNNFCVKPFTRKINRILGTMVYGRENLKGLKSAIVTCNHVNKMDCLVIKKAVAPKKTFTTAGSFNNQKGFVGEMMRAGGMLPMGDDLAAHKNFDRAISYHLKKNHFVVFYPEQAMWWDYEKPRPLKSGAFHYAVRNNVPVLPLFITFTDNGEIDENGIKLKNFHIHIMPPINIKGDLTAKENMEYLMQQNTLLCREKYEEFYGKKLEYLPENI